MYVTFFFTVGVKFLSLNVQIILVKQKKCCTSLAFNSGFIKVLLKKLKLKYCYLTYKDI